MGINLTTLGLTIDNVCLCISGPECNHTSGPSDPAAVNTREVLIQKRACGCFMLHRWDAGCCYSLEIHQRSLQRDHRRFCQELMGSNVFATMSELLSPRVFLYIHYSQKVCDVKPFLSFDFSFEMFKFLGWESQIHHVTTLFLRLLFFLPWELIFLLFKTIKALHQFWPFPPLRKQPALLEGGTSVGGRALLSIRHREENHKGSSAKRNIKA